uniref:Lipocalin/cytosolic fatty-acid binding domain-containing protein n=1 Tax=Pygocentrus nattereri TaxID=42514 RepID=A0AAR2J2Q7_PYGNA
AVTMPTTMLGMLGVLLCVLAVRADVMPQADFDLQKVGGTWYLVGFATNADWFVSRKADMKMGTVTLTPQSNGDLEMDYSSLKSDGRCKRMNHLAKKTDTPGRFAYRSWGSDDDMRVVDVKYDEYALFHAIKTKDGSSHFINKLYSRTQDPSQAVLDKFTKFSLEQGILRKNIAILPKSGQCERDRGVHSCFCSFDH